MNKVDRIEIEKRELKKKILGQFGCQIVNALVDQVYEKAAYDAFTDRDGTVMIVRSYVIREATLSKEYQSISQEAAKEVFLTAEDHVKYLESQMKARDRDFERNLSRAI